MKSSPTGLARPARIMRIIARLNIGGPAVHVSLVTAGLNDESFLSVLVAGQISPAEGDMAHYARERGVEPIIIPDLGREISLIGDLKTLIALMRLMREWRPDIAETHTAKAGLLGRAAARLCGVPIVIHMFHGHIFQGYFGRLKTSVFIALERLAARWCDAIVTVSERLREELIDLRIAPPEKIRVVPLGLELADLAGAKRHKGTLRRELGLKADAPIIGIVGRLAPIKNHALFLEAAARVAQQEPAAQIVIVGDGELRGELETRVDQMGLRGRTRFLGWRSDLAAIYADLNVAALTSRNEGTPVSLIEAMAAGTPVAATMVGGVSDVLEGGKWGRLVPPDDAEAMAEAILATLRQPDPGLLKQAQARALERYSANRLIADLRRLYTELLRQKGIHAKRKLVETS